MKNEKKNIERAISTGRIVSATKSQNGFIEEKRDFFKTFIKSLHAEIAKTSGPAELADLRQGLRDAEKEQAAFEKSIQTSSLRLKLQRGIDADKTPQIETRIAGTLSPPRESLLTAPKAESRAKTKTKTTIYGYAAVFSKLSLDLGGFVEMIEPGAFTKALGNDLDCRCLYNHDANLLLGRTKSGTLRVYQDSHGLVYYCDMIAGDSLSDGIVERIQRGDISGNSFGFIVSKDRWEFAKKTGDTDLRIIESISMLYDASPVSFPAYPDTTIGVETKSIDRDIDNEQQASLDRRDAAKKRLVEYDYKRAGQLIGRLRPQIEFLRKQEYGIKYRKAGRIINRCKPANL